MTFDCQSLLCSGKSLLRMVYLSTREIAGHNTPIHFQRCYAISLDYVSHHEIAICVQDPDASPRLPHRQQWRLNKTSSRRIYFHLRFGPPPLGARLTFVMRSLQLEYFQKVSSSYPRSLASLCWTPSPRVHLQIAFIDTGIICLSHDSRFPFLTLALVVFNGALANASSLGPGPLMFCRSCEVSLQE
jgi:hypothetical protein